MKFLHHVILVSDEEKATDLRMFSQLDLFVHHPSNKSSTFTKNSMKKIIGRLNLATITNYLILAQVIIIFIRNDQGNLN